MANTYTQIHIQVVFAVHNRQSLIRKEWKVDLYKYMAGIIKNYDHKVLQINGMPDHVHIFFGMRPTQSLSDLMKEVKQHSSKWINDKRLTKGKFSWQAGFGAFSYSLDQVPRVIRYIENQEEHHKHRSFQQEYTDLLDKFNIDYNEAYLFKPVI